MPPRLIRAARVILVLLAVSLAFVAFRKSGQSVRYFSTPLEVTGAVTAAYFADAMPLARGNPRAGEVTQPVPTRLDIKLEQHPGVNFQVWLPEDPALHPKLPAIGSEVTLILPSRWHEMEVGERVLAFGLKQGDTMLVDPKNYPYAAEYRTAFVAVGAGLGAAIALLGALTMRMPEPDA